MAAQIEGHQIGGGFGRPNKIAAHLLPCWRLIFDVHRLNLDMEAHLFSLLELRLEKIKYTFDLTLCDELFDILLEKNFINL